MKKPRIVISSLDAERLDKLIAARDFPGREDLAAELTRADIVEPKDIPPNVVTMNSSVKFRIESSSREFNLKLVYPDAVEPDGSTISILAPVGSALLGLSTGDEIEWPRPGGGVLRVRIEEITYQPERVGQYHL